MPILLKTDQGLVLYNAFKDVYIPFMDEFRRSTRCTCGDDKDEIEGSIELRFDKSGLKIMYYDADSVLKWNIKLKAEDTEIYKYSSEHSEITACVKPSHWDRVLRTVKRDYWITLSIN